MRYLLQKDESLETLLESLSQAAFSVVTDIVLENRREDIQVGMYVALSHVLSSRLVCGPDCGLSPVCATMRETSPLESPVRPAAPH
jgi:hypothetical protein